MSKRALDLVGATIGLLVLWPVFAVVAALIKLADGGPAFFVQTRIGRGGRPFGMLKFRTMTVDAEQRGGPLTIGDDPRITRFGRRLRASKLDELPQLVNVVAGDMSLVGPRPELPRYVAFYDAGQRQVLDLRPGITDPASIAYRHESLLLSRAADPEAFYVQSILPDKIRINLEYASRATIVQDLAVIWRTIAALFQGSSRALRAR
jgi:lipopolysaccharide/colanic/teichoic acid biosynthesis glycosyltransferase